MTIARRVPGVLLILIVAAGCSTGGDAERDLLKTRLAEVEQRLAALESRINSIDALNDGVKELERRVAAAEERAAQARQANATIPSPASPGQSGDRPAPPATAERSGPSWTALHGPGGEDRRAALMALGQEYRERVAKVREQYGDPSGSPEGQTALAEARQWYTERLRALMSEAREGTGDGTAK